MAVPKQRRTRSKGRLRRSKNKSKIKNLVECSQCREKKLPHQVCPHCGSYKGKQVIDIE